MSKRNKTNTKSSEWPMDAMKTKVLSVGGGVNTSKLAVLTTKNGQSHEGRETIPLCTLGGVGK